MADTVLTNTYTATGPTRVNLERESLADTVEQVYLYDAPLYNNLRKGEASALQEAWGTEDIPAIVVPDAHKQGYVAAPAAPITPRRLDNWCVLHYDSGGVSHTKEAVDEAGDTNSLEHQQLLWGRVHLRKKNKYLYARVAKNGSAEPFTAATPQAYITNFSSVAATPGTAPTGDGTNSFTAGTTPDVMDSIAPFDTVLQNTAFHQGRPRAMYMHPKRIKDFSNIPDASVAPFHVELTAPYRGAAPGDRDPASPFTYIGAVDTYQSDFGVVEKIRDIDADPTFVYVLDPDYIEVRHLPGMDMNDYMLGKRGSGSEFVIESQWTIAMLLPESSAIVEGYAP